MSTTEPSVTPDYRMVSRPSARSTFNDVLALVSSITPWSPAVLAGIKIASLCGGNLTGCYIPSRFRELSGYDAEAAALDLLIDLQEDSGDDSAAFESLAKRHDVQHAAWAIAHTGIAPALRQLGGWHDIAVLEQDMVESNRVFDIFGEAMLGCHLSCLILPRQWDRHLAFDRVVIGWNGSYESTRALHSALPLLQLAKEVVLINGEVHSRYGDPFCFPVPDPDTYLTHHGIVAKTKYLNVSAEDAGETLLKVARDVRADLLVMGAYSHSRMRERVLGGATRHVLAHADIPLLMRH